MRRPDSLSAIRRIAVASLGVAAIASAAAAHADEIEAAPVSADESAGAAPLPFGVTYQLRSDIYGQDREINVYAPSLPEWGEDLFKRPLPVVILIDGGADQDFFHIAGLSQLTLVNAERQPAIIVGIRTYNRRREIVPAAVDPRYASGEFDGWGGAEQFRRHIVEEVMPFIEARHDVGRAVLMGESLAGLFVVDTFLKAPATFDDYVAVSPSLWWDDRRLSKDAARLLRGGDHRGRRLYLTMADEGGAMRLGLDELVAALGTDAPNVEVKFVDRSASDTHASIYHHAARDALRWMFAIPAETYGETPWYLTVDGDPPIPE
ncbi:MAG: alpha/beta hydrolase [Alphaproteobacteria bacterium]|nr:alpha/beta hydrolase [Alphaproteobacteria bacterium]